MLDQLATAAADPLWAAASAFTTDRRSHRLDLTVGVYRDDNGQTPTMAAVRLAEQQLIQRGDSKAYRGLAGNPTFNDVMTALILGEPGLCNRAATVQTVAGSGALRLLAELIKAGQPGATVWISDPAYANHQPILRAAGLAVRRYTYLDRHRRLDSDTMFADLAQATRGDVVLIQGSCHNPTGTDLTTEAWKALADLCNRAGLIPFMDLAYAGLADSLQADLAPPRALLESVPEALVAVSCSKNFGLYAERTGCAIVVGPSPAHVTRTTSTLENIARAMYSMPPEHGAAIVATILHDHGLTQSWHAELAAMRTRLRQIRSELVRELRAAEEPETADLLAKQRGMFSLLPHTPEQMEQLRNRHAIHAAESGRINIAGIPTHRLSDIAGAIAAVSRHP